LYWKVAVVDQRSVAAPIPVRAPFASLKYSCRTAVLIFSVQSYAPQKAPGKRRPPSPTQNAPGRKGSAGN
jgi:hypothetical protein